MKAATDKREIFASMPVPQALLTMAVPTIISQMINLIYNMVDAFFIGRTGNSYMMAATSLTLTISLMNVALANLFGIGGGSLYARLLGTGRQQEAGRVSAFSVYGAIGISVLYSAAIGCFLNPVLRALGASDATIGYARQYTILVIVAGTLPALLSMVLGHLLRNAGYADKASIGLSSGGILNIALDPLFMFVLFPKGYEVAGAAAATLLSNIAACLYLLYSYRKASRTDALSMRVNDARAIEPSSIRQLFAVGVPSAILTGLFDLANIFVNVIASAHSDLVLAGMGIVMKVERLPNAINVGLCQGMLPIVAFNYSSGNHRRMKQTIQTARIAGLAVSFTCILLFELFAGGVTKLFMSTSGKDAQTALMTLGYAALFLRIRCIASPFQFTNYHSSYCMQAMGNGKRTMLHAFVRELVFYIPFMFLLDGLFGEKGLAAALVAGEACGALFALYLVRKTIAESALRGEKDGEKTKKRSETNK